MNLISDDDERPYVICYSCCRGFDLDWNQDLEVGDEDKEGRFELNSISDDERWCGVYATCPICHYRTGYGLSSAYHDQNRIRFAKSKESKIMEVLAFENFYLRKTMEFYKEESEQSEKRVEYQIKQRNVANRRYRRTRKELSSLADRTTRLADIIHQLDPEMDIDDIPSISHTPEPKKDNSEKKDFLHFR